LKSSRVSVPAASLAGAALLLASLLTGCLTPDQIAALQKDVTDMRTQMEQLRKENKETAASVKALETSMKQGDGAAEQNAENRRQLEAIRDDVRTVNSRLEELTHRLSGLSPSNPGASPRLAAPPAAGGSPPPAPTTSGTSPGPVPQGGSADPDELFNGAYADYSKGNYAPAILGFTEFLKRFPQTERADDALYWIGLCHYDQGEYGEAISQFDRLIQEYPSGDKVSGAHLKKGLSLLEMNRTAQGVVQLQYLVEHFPKSDEARIAKDRLQELGVKP
jgi:tol-pal system protein YbgF